MGALKSAVLSVRPTAPYRIYLNQNAQVRQACKLHATRRAQFRVLSHFLVLWALRALVLLATSRNRRAINACALGTWPHVVQRAFFREHDQGATMSNRANPRPPHPATVVQPKPVLCRQSPRPPHAATIVQSKRSFGALSGRRMHAATIVQPARLGLREYVSSTTTAYPSRNMAGVCEKSAREVAETLARFPGGGTVQYVAAVYREGREARNHIAATLTLDGETNVVDVTWKQFPFLLTGKAPSGERVLITSIREWEQMIIDNSPPIDNMEVQLFDDINEAVLWMKDQRQQLLAMPTHVPTGHGGKKKRGGCAIL